MSKFEMWLDVVNEKRRKHWDENYSYKEYTPLEVKKGKKSMKLIDGNIWHLLYFSNRVN